MTTVGDGCMMGLPPQTGSLLSAPAGGPNPWVSRPMEAGDGLEESIVAQTGKVEGDREADAPGGQASEG